MADKGAKKKSKRQKAQPSVLGSLPSQRPQRLGGRRAPRAAAPPPSAGPPRGTKLVTTAIQAAGELAQMGLTVGGRMVKRAVDRLPKP